MSKHRTHRTWRSRLLSGVLSLVLALGLLPPAALVQVAGAAHWADPYGEQLVEWGVMKPSPDLRLGDTTTRAEFAAMLNRAFGYSRLGETPFTDVSYLEWYAEDINIAYNAGYFKGTSDNNASPTASPTSTLTREEAAVMLARCMRLQETVGEGLSFTDSRELSDWSRGLVGAAAAGGVINGLPGGSFGPRNNITRGEVAAMLVRAIGNPISEPGEYGLDEVYGNVTINSSDVTLRDTVIIGDLYLTGGVDLGNVLLENVTVLGRIIISGGGESHEGRSSMVLRNVEADELTVDSMVNQFVTISAYGLTDIPVTNVRSDSYLEDSCADGYGLHHIELVGKSGTRLQLAGNIKEVVNKTPLSLLQLVKGTADRITIDEYATGSELLIDINTVVKELNLDVATRVYGKGDIIDLVIGADGCEVEILPEHVEIRPGITATVDGKKIGSTDADELSSEPRLLSGYPTASSNLRPTSAEGLYAGNKPGTIYWAISAIADGSVTRENLIRNPSYGGNILKDGEKYQSGSIGATARTEYARQITGLEPDGSYYISAVLVDERGNYSPLKVYSFTTPDDTVPAFVEGYPRMTKVSCEVAQVTAMANKSCTLHWVLLKAGATAPTVQNFKSGSFGGNYGSGSISVVKNVPVSVQVNSSRLQEKTDYDLYLWLSDADGILSSEVVKVLNAQTQKPEDPSFSTPDQTPPSTSNVRQINALADSIEFTFEINEAPSTLYWAVVLETETSFIRSTDDMNSLRIQRKVQEGSDPRVIVKGSKDAAGARTETTVNRTEFLRTATDTLSYDKYKTHNFRMYYVARDAEGNYSEVKSIIIHTADSEKPTVSISFSAAKYSTPEDQEAGRNPKPLPDTDITLIFSEQVKGLDENDKFTETFVELYSEVDRYLKQHQTETDKDINSENPTNPLTIAKNALGELLEKYIKLYYVEDGMPGTQLKHKGVNSPGDEEFGWLNLREATVKLNADNGTVAVTMPNGKAVQLGGGMQYYFHFEDIYDDAYTPNPLVVMRNGKVNTEGNMDSFTTVYAQVKLSVPKNVTRIVSDDATLNNIRLDMVFDLNPQSTSRAPDSEYWDIIIWTNTTVRFDLYRQIIKKDGADVETDKSSGWEMLFSGYGGKDGKGRFQMVLNDDSEAISLNKRWSATLEGSESNAIYTTVKDGLDENYIYRYGVHITEVYSDPEDKGLDAAQKANASKLEPIAWDAEIAWDISVIAGDINVMQQRIRNDIKKTYTEYKGLGYFSEIGDVNDGEASILTCYRSFEDLTVPSFRTGFPTVDTGSNSITMGVGLDGNRNGTVYYVVAPASGNHSIATKVNGTDVINVDDPKANPNDGSQPDATYGDASPKTYIPLDGNDRETGRFRNWIQFLPAAEGEKGGKYDSPIATDIVDGKYKGREDVVSGRQPVDSVAETIKVDGLKPNTWYYVYMVLKGGGDADDVVQIYRVKTKPVIPPVVSVETPTDVDDTIVIMTVNNRSTGSGTTLYDGSILYYALVNANSMPDIFQKYYNWVEKPEGTDNRGPYTGSTALEAYRKIDASASSIPNTFMTVLDAMMKQYTGANADGRTYFDRYAAGFKEGTSEDVGSLMSVVMSYISTTSIDGGRYTKPVSRNTKGTEENPKTEDFKGSMTDNADYIVLACARNVSSDKIDGASYGFAAVTLSKKDTAPPVFEAPAGREGLPAKYIPLINPTRASATSGDLTQVGWNGTISVNFNKDVYYHESNTGLMYTIVYNTGGLADDQKNVLSVLGGDAVVNNHVDRNKFTGAVGNQFSLKLKGITHLEPITFFVKGKICNADDYTTDYQLTLTFHAELKEKDYDTASDDETFLNLPHPGFSWEWKEVKTNN